MRTNSVVVIMLVLSLAGAARAANISDNSFFMEEAYNQDPGVVQHIQNFYYLYEARDPAAEGSWAYSFTQEWPVGGRKNQLSYSIPVIGLGGDDKTTGVGDVLLHGEGEHWQLGRHEQVVRRQQR